MRLAGMWVNSNAWPSQAGPSVNRGLKGPATISNAHAIVSSWSCLMSDCVSPGPAHCPQLMLESRPRLGIGYTGTHHETTPVRIHARGEGLDHGVGHFRPLSITRQRHWLAYHFIAMRHEGLCQVF